MALTIPPSIMPAESKPSATPAASSPKASAIGSCRIVPDMKPEQVVKQALTIAAQLLGQDAGFANLSIRVQRLENGPPVGFPVLFLAPGGNRQTAGRFSHLMRELSLANGGTFVGLNGLD